jgi:sugar (pentulose or hexulose) kinase
MSGAWLQIISDVLGRPLMAMRDPQDAGARGAAACILVGLGHQRDFAFAQRDAAVETVYEPSAATRDAYERRYARFRQLYERLGGLSIEADLLTPPHGAVGRSSRPPSAPVSTPASTGERKGKHHARS